MLKSISIIILLSFFLEYNYGQINFRSKFERSNPAPIDTNLTLGERLIIHKQYEEGKKEGSIEQLYSQLYFFYDYLITQDFTTASQYLLKAETIATKSGNKDWMGWVTHRWGILYTILNQQEKALEAYEKAAELSRAGGDSLCLAESLEQISVMNARLGNFSAAQKNFELAKPMIEKFGGQKQLAAMLSNYGITLSTQDRVAEGLTYYKKAMAIYAKNDFYRDEGKLMNNMGDAYRHLGYYDSSIAILQKCLQFNAKLGFRDNMIRNYQGMYAVMELKGNYQSALDYYIQYSNLKDSISGTATQNKIAALESKYNISQKDLEVQQSKAQLLTARHSIEVIVGISILLLLLGTFLYWRSRSKATWLQTALKLNKTNLTTLTRLLLEKNTRISELEEKHVQTQFTPAIETEDEGDDSISETLYNRRILTNEDWVSFKNYFEKGYPGFLQRLRTACPAMSEAEERLFLFIKLNLTNKEAAAILGISADSIKKTRSRLKKRLGLDQAVILDDYIRMF